MSRSGRVTKNKTVIVWGTTKIRVFLLNVPGGERRKRGREKMLLIQLVTLFFSAFIQIFFKLKPQPLDSNANKLNPTAQGWPLHHTGILCPAW